MEKEKIYLNNAATSYPKPKEIEDAVVCNLRSFPLNLHRGGLLGHDTLDEYRKQIAEFFGIKNHKRLFFTSGSTEALNLVIRGLDLCSKNIVTTATEHNSVLRPIFELLKIKMTDATIVPCDASGYVDPDNIKKAITPSTKLIVVNHCSNVTGTVQDIAEIAKIARAHNAYLLVDASQSAGNIPIDVERDCIDMLAFTGHKSLYGLNGVGGIYIKEKINIKPLKTGGTGFKSRQMTHPEEEPYIYEAGTPNYIGIASVAAGIKYIKRETIEKIRAHKQKLIRMFTDEFKDNSKIKLYLNEKNYSYSVLSFNIENVVAEDAAFILESSYGILVRAGLHCCPLIHKHIGSEPFGTIRISPGYFTSEKDIEKLITAVHKLILYGEKEKIKVVVPENN